MEQIAYHSIRRSRIAYMNRLHIEVRISRDEHNRW